MGYAKTAFIVAVTAVALQLWPIIFTPKLVYEFGGHVEPGFEKVEQLFKQHFDIGWEFEGGAFAVCHKGKMVVDIWGGYADSSAARVWRQDTMTTVYSTTKAVSALCLAMLVDRGYLKYTDLVTKYWPEFGQNGKDKITIKMVASHEAGLVVLDEPITFDVIRDWRKMSAAFEKQKPNWEIGTGTGYHAVTYGWLIDQLVRRVDPKKRSLGQFFREEIAEPHNIDFYIGLPLELEYRVARMVQPRIRDTLLHLTDLETIKVLGKLLYQPADSIMNRAAKNPEWVGNKNYFIHNNPEFHALEIGAANGIGTARALAQLFCLIDSGKLLNKTTVDILLKPVFVSEVEDYTLRVNMTWGWGFVHIKNPDGNYAIGFPGYGGQNVRYDPQYKLSIGSVRNGLAVDLLETWSFTALKTAVYEAVKNNQLK